MTNQYKFSLLMSSESFLLLEPSQLNFGIIPVSDHPVSREFKIINHSDNTMILKFKDVSSNFLWFTDFNSMTEAQRKTGFDIFYTGDKLESLLIKPQSTTDISCVILSSHLSSQFPINVKIPVFVIDYIPQAEEDYSDDDIDIDDDSQILLKTETKLQINATLSSASFQIQPPHLFLNNCRLNESQTRTVSLINLCDAPLPIMIHPAEEISFITPSLPNFINLPPKKTVELTMTYTPSELGQFEHKIQFDCLLKTESPSYLKVLTAVSPSKIPVNFPIIHPANEQIDFGEIYAGKPVTTQILVENKSPTPYKIFVHSVFEYFLNMVSNVHSSFTTSLGSSTTFDSLNSSEPTLFFRTASMPKPLYEVELLLEPKSSTAIQVEYTPSFNLRAKSSEFDQRSFMIMMQFTDMESQQVYYRLIQCSAQVCQSIITVSPTSVDFGDTVIANSTKTATITVNNNSPLPTTVKPDSGSRSFLFDHSTFDIKGNSSATFTFTFYPRRVNPEYNGRISFQNLNNAANVRVIPISAIVVAGLKESIHSTSYSLTMDFQPINYINFQNVISSYPAVKELSIKNKTKEPLSLTFNSSNPENLRLYIDHSTGTQEKRNLISAQQSIKEIQLAEVSIITADKRPTTLKQLVETMRGNSAFFKDMYTLFPKYDGRALCEHFINQKKAYKDILASHTVQDITGTPIVIPPLTKQSIFVSLVPEKEQKDSNKWIHRRYNITINLNGEKQSISTPLQLPVSFNVITAYSFISAHSLNFGNILTGSRSQKIILIANESLVPLPFVIECEGPISIDKHPTGVILPLSSFNVPFTYAPLLDGQTKNFIRIINVFNDSEKQEIQIKANVEKRSNFFLHPLEIDFGTVTSGVCSDPIQLFITNTSAESNEFTFSHAKQDRDLCTPLLMFHIKKLSERKLTEAAELQIDKLQKKLIQLIRKGKKAKIIKNQRMIDDLSNTKIVPSETKLKQLDAKFMDRLVIQADPQQMDCIEVQLIPSTLGRRLPMELDIEGSIIVYEKGKTETQKMIKYKAHIIPQPQRILDSNLSHSISVDPQSIDLGQVYVHDTIQRTLTVTNRSNTQQNFWFSANSSADAIITTNKTEVFLKYNESVELPFEVFIIQPGRLLKEISITTQTSSFKIPITGTCKYREVLKFTALDKEQSLDFGYIPLTSLTLIEERRSFGIQNITDSTVFVYLHNPKPGDLVIYENDPKIPIIRPFVLQPHQYININVLFRPVMDREIYRSYKSMIFDDNITATVFSSEEEAAAFSSKPVERPDCIFTTSIGIKAVIGRIGLVLSDQEIQFGAVDQLNQMLQAKLQIKNRSSHIPLTVLASCSQGLSVSDYVINLSGKKEGKHTQELTVLFQPSAWGMNEATLRFTIPGSVSYSKAINVMAFADQNTMTTDLKKDDKGIDTFDIGGIYVENGKPIKKDFKFQLTNCTNQSIRFEMPELKKKFFSRAKDVTTVKFDFPFSNVIYDEDEPTFNYRLTCTNLSTKAVIKIINLTGFFCVSTGAFDNEEVAFEQFGQINHWAHKEKTVTILNNSNIPLLLERSMEATPNNSAQNSQLALSEYDDETSSMGLIDTSISTSSTNLASKDQEPDYFIVPQVIGPIPPLGTYTLKVEPNIDTLKNVEGVLETFIKYINKHNADNILYLNVLFNISASFVKFDHVNPLELAGNKSTVSQTISSFKEIEGEIVGGCWFGLTCTSDVETVVNLSVKAYDAKAKEAEPKEGEEPFLNFGLFIRSSGRAVNQLVLQPRERTEIRVKVTLNGTEDEISLEQPHLGDIILSHEGSEPLTLPIMYKPSIELAQNQPMFTNEINNI